MKPNTTPTNTFTLPFEPTEGMEFRIVYAQGEDYKEKILFERTTETMNIDGRKITVKLTADETRLFDCKPHHYGRKFAPYPIKIQIGAESRDGDKVWSEIMEDTVGRVLRRDGVINGRG